jgi:hypothetical protein
MEKAMMKPTLMLSAAALLSFWLRHFDIKAA